MRVADYVMTRLVAEGISKLFLVTGRGILYLSDAAAKNENIDCICPHHEQAAGFAASAYAQCNHNHIGACLVSTGCAATNVITPILCAWQDEIPLVVISGQNFLNETERYRKIGVRTFGQQEADIVKVVQPITKYAVMLENPNDIVQELDKIFFYAKSGRKGPVLIDIPIDLQSSRIEPEAQKHFIPSTVSYKCPSLSKLYSLLNKAQRPVLLLGANSFSVRQELSAFINKHQIPVVYEAGAVNVYPAVNELSIGAVGTMAANRAGNFAIQNSDLIITIGAKLSSMTVGLDSSKFARKAQIVVVDIDDSEIKKNTVNIDEFICTDLKSFFTSFKLDFKVPNVWKDKCLHWKKIFAKCEERYHRTTLVDIYILGKVLSDLLDEDAIFVTDSGLEQLILPTTISFKENQLCIQPESQGAMGFALPAAIGAWYACKRQTVVVTGDGSIMMNIQELQTVVHNHIPLKIIIVNNNGYSVIRKRQQDLFRTRTVGTDSENGLSCPDFSKVAACFGIQYIKICNESELYNKLKDVLSFNDSIICEVMSPVTQEYLHSSFARTKTGKFVQRPLEDQAPYLDRDLFLSEMIVEPIDQ